LVGLRLRSWLARITAPACRYLSIARSSSIDAAHCCVICVAQTALASSFSQIRACVRCSIVQKKDRRVKRNDDAVHVRCYVYQLLMEARENYSPLAQHKLMLTPRVMVGVFECTYHSRRIRCE